MKRAIFKYLFPFFFLLSSLSCQEGEGDLEMKELKKEGVNEKESSKLDPLHEASGELEERIREAGLVSVEKEVEGVQVDLKYSSEDNFLGEDLYGDLETCYVHPDLAEKLELAQLFLQNRYPSYSLVIYDGVRPLSVQKKMWEALEIPVKEKRKFLASPGQRSLHNYGAAVDLSILNGYGQPLDMGTPFDHRGEKAYPRKEEELLKKGELSEEAVENRKLLREVMEKAGFSGISTEWWHFSIASRREAKRNYELVE